MAQTQQQSLITVVVDGFDLGVFDTKSGGEITAEPTKRRSGGMGAQKSYAAMPDYGDLTVSRDYELERDHELFRRLGDRVGRAQASISEQALDDDGVPKHKPKIYSGRLIGLTPGEVDSDSSDPQMLELSFQIVGVQ